MSRTRRQPLETTATHSTTTMSWAFDHLNHLSPLDTSPVNGPGDDTDRNDFSLSYPINGSALHAQLEAWTSSVAFDFDSPDSFGTPLGGGTADEMREKDDQARQHYLGAGLYGGLGSDGSYASLLADPAMGFGATPFDTIYQGPIPAQGLLPPLPAFPSSTATDLFVAENKKRSAGEMEAPAGVPGVVLGGDEEANALAIEEDKRKRNTAASGESPSSLIGCVSARMADRCPSPSRSSFPSQEEAA